MKWSKKKDQKKNGLNIKIIIINYNDHNYNKL